MPAAETVMRIAIATGRTGSAITCPVMAIQIPPAIPITDETVSPATCRNALRMFRSWLP
jgi:hypothetical protein